MLRLRVAVTVVGTGVGASNTERRVDKAKCMKGRLCLELNSCALRARTDNAAPRAELQSCYRTYARNAVTVARGLKCIGEAPRPVPPTLKGDQEGGPRRAADS